MAPALTYRPGKGGPGRDGGTAGGRRSPMPLKVGLLIPLSGAAGIWGPSCEASAMLAAAELNQSGGILGREIEVVVGDGGREPDEVAQEVADLDEEHGLDAIVGMHISAVRQSLVRRFGGRMPYVYTPLYEGGERTPGVFAIGETPVRQLAPAIHWLSDERKASRWALIGNDYVWPRVSHRLAHRYVREAGGKVVAEQFLPLGCTDFERAFDLIRSSNADAVLLSLVGEDAVHFNRAFAREGLDRHVLRLSAAIEENALLAIGASRTENLYATAGYFGGLRTPANQAFLERYHTAFGDSAPVMNALGESCYEGMRFLAALCERAGSVQPAALAAARYGMSYRGARGEVGLAGSETDTPIYLAEAQGHDFSIRACLSGGHTA